MNQPDTAPVPANPKEDKPMTDDALAKEIRREYDAMMQAGSMAVAAYACTIDHAINIGGLFRAKKRGVEHGQWEATRNAFLREHNLPIKERMVQNLMRLHANPDDVAELRAVGVSSIRGLLNGLATSHEEPPAKTQRVAFLDDQSPQTPPKTQPDQHDQEKSGVITDIKPPQDYLPITATDFFDQTNDLLRTYDKTWDVRLLPDNAKCRSLIWAGWRRGADPYELVRLIADTYPKDLYPRSHENPPDAPPTDEPDQQPTPPVVATHPPTDEPRTAGVRSVVGGKPQGKPKHSGEKKPPRIRKYLHQEAVDDLTDLLEKIPLLYSSLLLSSIYKETNIKAGFLQRVEEHLRRYRKSLLSSKDFRACPPTLDDVFAARHGSDITEEEALHYFDSRCRSGWHYGTPAVNPVRDLPRDLASFIRLTRKGEARAERRYQDRVNGQKPDFTAEKTPDGFL